MHIVVADDLPGSAVALLRDEGWTVDAVTGRSSAELADDLRLADGLIVRSATRVTADVLRNAGTLRVIARAGAGVDNIDVPAAAARGIVVLNAPGASSNSVAELALAFMLALARHVSAADSSMKAGRWEKKAFAGSELSGKTLGVVGYGRIGRMVGGLARAFGMQVVAHDPVVAPEIAEAAGAKLVTLDELCAAADYVSLHMPAGAETRHLFDAARLASCRKGVRLINTARGELIDERALLAALESGHVAGAGLDVFEQEPPADATLTGHPAVVATPHVGASTREAQERVGLETAAAVRDYLKDGQLRNVVSV